MTLNEYQKKAMTTCMPTCGNVIYMGFNLSAEVGELLGKLAKAVRKDKLRFTNDDRDKYEYSNSEIVEIYDLTESEWNDIKK